MNTPDPLMIFSDGQWHIHVTPPLASDEVLSFAISELQQYLARLAGTPVTQSVLSPQSIPLILHLDCNSHLPQDAFTITVSPARILLSGTTGRGVLYAVYALLEELGCLWVYPTEAENIVPRQNTLSLKPGQRTESPSLAHRGLGLYGLYADTVELGREMIDWMAKNRLNLILTSADRQDEPTRAQAMHWPEVAAELLPEIRRRGMILEHSEHMTHLFFPPALFEKHPDWFALVDGRRQCRQMCFSNPDAVAYFAEQLAAYAAAHPEARVLGTWPLDGAGYCECDDCRQPDVAFKAIRRVAEAVAQVRQDLTVEYLAYTPQTLPVPVATPALPNMSALYCAKCDELARQWVQHMRGARGACYFEYTMGDNYHWKANVWLRPEAGIAIARALREIGFHGVISLFLPIRNWWRSAFNTWFLARAFWKPEINVARELNLYADRYFGDLAAEVRPLLDQILYRLQNPLIQEAFHGVATPGQTPISTDPDSLRAAQIQMQQDTRDLGEALLKLEHRTCDDVVRLRLRRWRTYVEYFGAYYPTRSEANLPRFVPGTPIPHDLIRWLQSQPAELAMVNAPSDFLDWRFDKFTAWGG
jgi:hypothetical protein